MLASYVINAAKSSAQYLSDKGITVMPNGDHELGTLNKLAMHTKDVTIHDAQALSSFVDGLGQSSDNSEHHKTLIGFSEQISKLAATHIAHDHSVVAPMVNEFATKLSDFLSSLKAVNPTTLFDIVRYSKPIILDNSVFTNELKDNCSESIVPTGYFNLPAKTEEEVVEYLKFPQAHLNNDIAEWWVSTNGFAYRLYQNIFGSGTPSGTTPLAIDTLNNLPIHQRIDAGILLTLMVAKISSDIPKDLKMGLKEFQTLVEDYKDYASCIVTKASSMYDQAVANSYRIISSASIKPYGIGAEIVVFGESYDKWLSEGGKPEVLLGCVVAEKGAIMHKEAISAGSQRYLDTWNTFETIENSRFKSNKDSVIKGKIEQLGLETIAQVCASEEHSFYKSEGYSNGAKARLAKCLSGIDVAGTVKVYDIAIDIVAGCAYFNTNSHQTLKIIHDLGEQNPNMNPKDAATIAAISYICDFVTTLIGVKKI